MFGNRTDLSAAMPQCPVFGSRGAAREQAICDATLALLAEVGYDKMTMDAIAAQARASKATIYRKWPGKQELVIHAIQSRVVTEFVPPDTGSLRGDIISTLRTMACGIGETDAALISGALRAMRKVPELGDCMRSQIVEKKRRIAVTLVDRAIARGELQPGTDPDIFNEVAPALMFFRVLVLGSPVDDPFLEHITDDVILPLLTGNGAGTPTHELPERGAPL